MAIAIVQRKDFITLMLPTVHPAKRPVSMLTVFIILIVLIGLPIPAVTASAKTYRISTRHSITKSTFNFNKTEALIFFQSLVTPSNLLRTFPNSTMIYLGDDQQLD